MEVSPARATGRGWVTFAAIMFLIVGAFNVIDGIGMVVDDNYYRADDLLAGNLSLFGWLAICMGGGQILLGYGILRENIVAQVVAVFLAGFNAILHLFALGAYPAWSIIIMSFDVLVIYGLVMYGRAFNEA
jgi:hypothetical protein